MKVFFLTMLAGLLSSSLSAQISADTTLNPASESSDMKFGKLVLEMPFGANLYQANNSGASKLIENLKSSFSGKALFIDFWGTWCTPCIQAMPNQKRMYYETKDLPIEFIYMCISTGSSLNEWITKISIMKQPGIHLFVNHDLEYEIMGLFNVGGFPSYVFIDVNGEYIPGAIPTNSSTTSDRLRVLIR